MNNLLKANKKIIGIGFLVVAVLPIAGFADSCRSGFFNTKMACIPMSPACHKDGPFIYSCYKHTSIVFKKGFNPNWIGPSLQVSSGKLMLTFGCIYKASHAKKWHFCKKVGHQCKYKTSSWVLTSNNPITYTCSLVR